MNQNESILARFKDDIYSKAPLFEGFHGFFCVCVYICVSMPVAIYH